MSALARLGLRVAAVQMLREDPIVARATGGRVLDSASGEIEASACPQVLLHTESTEGEAWSQNNGGPPFDLSCDLVCEITFVASAANDTGEAVLFRPVTTAEMEAALDLIELRIPEVLAFAETPIGLAMRRSVLKRLRSYQSERFEDDDGVKRASRLLRHSCELKTDEASVRHPAAPDPSGPFATLPQPLRGLAPLLPAGSAGRDVLLQLAAAMPADPAGEAFAGAAITIRPGPRPRPDPTDGAEFGAEATLP